MIVKKRNVVVLAVVCAFLFSAPQPVQARNVILEFFFPSLRKYDKDPSDTLQAPFAADEATENGTPDFKVPSPDNTVPIDRQHRVNEEIVEWLEVVAAEALNFGKETYEADLARTEEYFDTGGRRLYMAFLEQIGIAKAMKTGNYAMSNFVKEPPTILNQGVVNGRYSWLMRVPVTVSYFKDGITDYKEAKVVNQSLSLTIQVGRRMDVEEPGVVIERWTGKVQ